MLTPVQGKYIGRFVSLTKNQKVTHENQSKEESVSSYTPVMFLFGCVLASGVRGGVPAAADKMRISRSWKVAYGFARCLKRMP